MNKIKIGSRKSLVKNLLLVEGISRAGKFLLANLFGGIDGVEPMQYHGLLEHVPVLEKFGFLNKKIAQELLKTEIDFRSYEMIIGRNFNHRISDKSSIYNVPKYKSYLQRSVQKDTNTILKDFYKKNPYNLFIVHELMPNIQIYLNIFPKIKIISLKRNPVDLVYSWYKRGLNKRLGKDPILFMIPFQKGKKIVQWFTPQSKEYFKVSNMDKIILLMDNLFKMYQLAYNKLPLKYKKKIFFIYYEDILSYSTEVIKNISKFLKKDILPEMKIILKREKLPNNEYILSRNKKISEIKKLSSPKIFHKLILMEKDFLKDYSLRKL